MPFGTFKLVGAALVAATMLVPAAADAQYYGARGPTYGYARSDYARDGYRPDYRDPRHPGPDQTYHHGRRNYRHCDHGTGGTILGAIAGGLLGNAAVGRRGDNTAGTIAGAGVGALVGNAIDNDC